MKIKGEFGTYSGVQIYTEKLKLNIDKPPLRIIPAEILADGNFRAYYPSTTNDIFTWDKIDFSGKRDKKVNERSLVIPYEWIKPLVDSLVKSADSEFGKLRAEISSLRSTIRNQESHIENLRALLRTDTDYNLQQEVRQLNGKISALEEELARSRATIKRMSERKGGRILRDIDV